MKIVTESPEEPREVMEFLEAEAGKLGLSITMHPRAAELDGPLLRLPVRVNDEMDAYEEACKLQDLEDAWNNRKPKRYPRLWLLPAIL